MSTAAYVSSPYLGADGHRGTQAHLVLNTENTMLLAHAVVLAEARSYLAAFADTARTVAGSIAYERVLIRLDLAHGDQAPAHTDLPHGLPADLLHQLAIATIGELVRHGIDALEIELILADLDDAYATDAKVNGRTGGA
ncbi:hypothetical protein ACIA03_08635 [Nocardioides sp. NPDC051685]|uniref:hypothetical protein n=1 Tax=Nocardioides sp. NPDC051685 TaxID=3364334 RepID=UPI00378A7D7A